MMVAARLSPTCSNTRSTRHHHPKKRQRHASLAAMFIPLLFVFTLLMINKENRNIRRHWVLPNSNDSGYTLRDDGNSMIVNPYSIKPGGLPGYTGWSRPEQTLAGYFDIEPLSHPTAAAAATTGNANYHAITMSGEMFSLLLTCNHNRTSSSHRHGDANDDSIVNEMEDEPPYYYECPEYGGSLFYVRAYGPSVITGIVTDMHNSSYSLNMQFIDPGEYTIEVVITFSLPMDYDEFPLVSEKDDESLREEPGYEGYMLSGFPLQILVLNKSAASSSSQRITNDKKDEDDVTTKPWCTLSQLTETSTESALYKGYWQVIDNVAHMSHQQLTPDETSVSLDGYRMGLNSLGLRMQYVYTDCELIHIHDLAGAITDGGMDQCLNENLDFNIIDNSISFVDIGTVDVKDNTSATANVIATKSIIGNEQERSSSIYEDKIFEGIHVIFIGDSVMRLVMSFFLKLVHKSRGFKVTFIETNGGIHSTIQNVTSTLENIRTREVSMNVKRVILFNSGLHDIDILCSSKRSRTRSKTYVTTQAVSCQDAYRMSMTKLITVLDEYPAEMKVFRSTTAGWHKVSFVGSVFIVCHQGYSSFVGHRILYLVPSFIFYHILVWKLWLFVACH